MEQTEFPSHPFLSIEPCKKSQQKELDRYREELGITTNAEDFALKCILSFEWNKLIYLQKIEKVKLEHNMIQFKVSVRVPSRIVNYSCSNPFKEEGWRLDTFEERAREVYWQLRTYIV